MYLGRIQEGRDSRFAFGNTTLGYTGLEGHSRRELIQKTDSIACLLACLNVRGECRSVSN